MNPSRILFITIAGLMVASFPSMLHSQETDLYPPGRIVRALTLFRVPIVELDGERLDQALEFLLSRYFAIEIEEPRDNFKYRIELPEELRERRVSLSGEDLRLIDAITAVTDGLDIRITFEKGLVTVESTNGPED